MSIRQIDVAMRSAYPNITRSVLVALAWFADDDGGRVFPSVATLGARTGCSRATIHRALATLRAAGVLEVVTPSRANRPTVYRLHIAAEQGGGGDVVSTEGSQPETSQAETGLTGGPEGSQAETRGVSHRDMRGLTLRPNPSGICQGDLSVNGHRAPRRPARLDRHTRLPEDFPLTAARQAFAEAGGLNAALEFAAFKDHHRAKGTRFVNWDAGWQTWCRRAHEFHRPTPARGDRR